MLYSVLCLKKKSFQIRNISLLFLDIVPVRFTNRKCRSVDTLHYIILVSHSSVGCLFNLRTDISALWQYFSKHVHLELTLININLSKSKVATGFFVSCLISAIIFKVKQIRRSDCMCLLYETLDPCDIFSHHGNRTWHLKRFKIVKLTIWMTISFKMRQFTQLLFLGHDLI